MTIAPCTLMKSPLTIWKIVMKNQLLISQLILWCLISELDSEGNFVHQTEIVAHIITKSQANSKEMCYIVVLSKFDGKNCYKCIHKKNEFFL